ncbi:MAG: hypothetical protein ACREQK_17060, partial [Candidatus Binatia bacterium]
KPLALSRLGLPLSEKQIPQVVENPENVGKSKEALEAGRYAPKAGALPGCATPRHCTLLILNHFRNSCNGVLSQPWQNRDRTRL